MFLQIFSHPLQNQVNSPYDLPKSSQIFINWIFPAVEDQSFLGSVSCGKEDSLLVVK
jgi:hypothetical protein